MSDDKPLHVRVAEALGCHPYWHDDYWFCDESGGPCKAKKQNAWAHDGYNGGIARYDLDWAVTGPLLEKYRIFIRALALGGWLAEAHTGEREASGDTPLIAVCDLILALKESGKL